MTVSTGFSIILPCFLLAVLPLSAAARPEAIRSGHSYYSDEYVTEGLVRDIAAERNYEEVYQLYSYYEAIYDDAGRVVTFREYERGEIIRVEEYRYAPGPDGALLEQVVKERDEPPQVRAPKPPVREHEVE